MSVLRNLGIEMNELMNVAGALRIIVDAEYDRLDQILDGGQNRILPTVQMKRADSLIQLQNLKQRGYRCVMVRGNTTYLKNTGQASNAYANFRKGMEIGNVELVGASPAFLQKAGINISTDRILELQGFQSLCGSSLWIYFNGGFFTSEAFSYLKRRGELTNVNRYIATEVSHLLALAENHFLYLFIDTCCRNRYLRLVQWVADLAASEKT